MPTTNQNTKRILDEISTLTIRTDKIEGRMDGYDRKNDENHTILQRLEVQVNALQTTVNSFTSFLIGFLRAMKWLAGILVTAAVSWLVTYLIHIIHP
ncbi:MAG TPA: hypothetical protein VFA10_14275 [Ktedonobacteraceae bacterium]|nr:hypothetical protein [Ktedonobacteraceae bacterium]